MEKAEEQNRIGIMWNHLVHKKNQIFVSENIFYFIFDLKKKISYTDFILKKRYRGTL